MVSPNKAGKGGSLEFAGPVGSSFLTKFGPTGPVAVATKSKFLATATATAKN